MNLFLRCKISEGIPVNFKEWRAIEEDRSECRRRAYLKHKPPSEQKDTQPITACSGGFINAQLFAICSFFAFGEYNLI